MEIYLRHVILPKNRWFPRDSWANSVRLILDNPHHRTSYTLGYLILTVVAF